MQKDESQISRQARWQRKHRAMGLCVLCSRPAFKGWRCKKHYEQHKITMRLRYIPKVRGRYKVSGATETATKRKAAKPAKTTARTAKPAVRKAKPAKAKPATRATSRTTTARKSVKATAKTTARKSTARKTTTRRAAPKRAKA